MERDRWDGGWGGIQTRAGLSLTELSASAGDRCYRITEVSSLLR